MFHVPDTKDSLRSVLYLQLNFLEIAQNVQFKSYKGCTASFRPTYLAVLT